MRRKRRYLAFETAGGEQNVYQAVAAICKKLGVDKDEIKIILQNKGSRQGLLRCSHLLANELKKTISGDSSLKILGVSGTIRAARKKFFSQDQKDESLQARRR